jgi:excisionase family DNA binding protein
MAVQDMDWDSLPQFFGVARLKEFLGIGEAAAYSLVRRRDFPCLKIGRNIRISKDGLRRWVEQQVA